MWDGLSALQSIAGHHQNNLVKRILSILNSLQPNVRKADKLAKDALNDNVNKNKFLNFSDLKPLTNSYITGLWQEEWDQEVDNKLKQIVTRVTEGIATNTKNRKQETLLSRLLIGHSWLTHSFILRKEDSPLCHSCDCTFTIKHILTDCMDLLQVRRQFYTQDNMRDLFSQVNISKIFDYLSAINLYNRI